MHWKKEDARISARALRREYTAPHTTLQRAYLSLKRRSNLEPDRADRFQTLCTTFTKEVKFRGTLTTLHSCPWFPLPGGCSHFLLSSSIWRIVLYNSG
eukprot:IDg15605t1